MHRALQIPELLLLTLSQLDLCVFYAPERVKERTALAAAATCTAWKEPALKILWKEMHDVIPLFKLLAPMTCRVLEAPDDCGTYNEWVGPFILSTNFSGELTFLLEIHSARHYR